MVKTLLSVIVVIFLMGTIGEKNPKEKEIYLMGLTITLTLLIVFTLLR